MRFGQLDIKMIFLAACVTTFCLGSVYGDGNNSKVGDVLHPSENSKLTCNRTGTCPGGPCQYQASQTMKEDPIISAIGTPIPYECGDLIGQWSGFPRNYSTLIKSTTDCYLYNSTYYTFYALEVLIQLPTNGTTFTVLWNDGKNNITEFYRTSTEVNVVFGIPDDCYETPDTTALDVEVLHPSKNTMLACNTTGSCPGGPCQYQAYRTMKGLPLLASVGVPIAYECGDLTGHWIGFPENASALTNFTTNCYQYNSTNHTFYALEVLTELPSNANFTVLWNDGEDNITEFYRSSTEVNVVFGIPGDCYKIPDATNAPQMVIVLTQVV